MPTVKSLSGATLTSAGTVLVLNENMNRCGATFTNDSDTTMYLHKTGGGPVNQGIRLNANGGAYEIDRSNPYFGQISVACSAASKRLTWTEDTIQ